MAEFASKGVGVGGLTTGIIGTSLGVLAGGLNGLGMGGLFGGNNNPYDRAVTRYELSQESRIAELQSQIALRDANVYNDQKLLEFYKYVDGELKDIRQTQCDKWAAQGVINAKFESAIDVLGSQVASVTNTVASITKTAVPTSALCNFCSPCGNSNI